MSMVNLTGSELVHDSGLPDLDTVVVEYYPYRTASVVPFTESFKRNEYMTEPEQLADKCGVLDDNHVVYGILTPSGKIFYVWFHDLRVYIGNDVLVEEPGKSVLSA